MNSIFRRLTLTLSILGVSGAAWSIPVCNSGAVCEAPGATGQSPTLNASSVLGLQALNSVGPNGNQVNSNYFFAVTSTDLGATIGSITNSGTGLRVVGVTPTHNGSSTPGSSVTAGAVQGTKGGTAYYVYAQACPAATAANGTNCSAWAKVDASQITTAAYPTSVFSAPVKPTDATISSIAARTNVPAGDVSNVSVVNVTVNDLITPANNQTLPSITYSGNGSPYILDNSVYTNGFKPNTKYSYSGQVQYPWDLVTASGETEGPFWTTPATPGTVAVSAITHCSAQISALNSSGSPANPSYTSYSLCASGTGGSCGNSTVSGATPTDTASTTLTNLNPGTSYTPTAQALVGNGDGTSSGWNSSGVQNGTSFSTLGFAGTFGITNITTTSADFTFSGLDLTGITSYQMIVNGSGFGSVVNSAPVSPIHLAGLAANTQYSVQIKLIEASCSSIVPTDPASSNTRFYTAPAAPTGGSFGAINATSVVVNWTDSSTNPNGTAYHLQYSANGGTTWTDFGTNPTKSGSSVSTTLTSLTPETTYTVRVKTVSASGSASSDSAYLQIPGTAVTPDTNPTLAPIVVNVYTSSAALSVTADNGGRSTLFYHWDVTGSPAGATYSFTANDSTSANSTYLKFNPTGSYTVKVTVTDHAGAGPGTSNESATLSPGQSASTIDPIVPGNGTLVVGFAQSYDTVVRDQFGTIIAGQGVNWSATPGVSLNPSHITNSTFTLVTGVDSLHNPVTLTASLPGAASQTVTLTINPSGPQLTSGYPKLVLDSNGLTGTATCLATDNSPGATAMQYAWTLESGPAGAPTPTWSPNNSTSAGVSTVTFYKAGAYVLRCTASDNFSSAFGVTPSTTVVQILSGLTVSPKSATVKTLQDQTFMAKGIDQFKNDYPLQSTTWSNSGGGSLSGGSPSSINFSSPGLGSNITVKATSLSRNGIAYSDFATVTVINYDVSGAYAYPVPFKSTRDPVIHFVGLNTQSEIRIYTTSGRQVFSVKATDKYDWDTKNSSGDKVASGVYFYFVESPEGKKDGKLIIIQ